MFLILIIIIFNIRKKTMCMISAGHMMCRKRFVGLNFSAKLEKKRWLC